MRAGRGQGFSPKPGDQPVVVTEDLLARPASSSKERLRGAADLWSLTQVAEEPEADC